MTDLKMEKLLELAANPEIEKNSNSLMSMLQEGNRLLSEAQKMANMLRAMGVYPALIRSLGKKYDIDVETPLKTESGITPSSDYHKTVLTAINEMSQEDVVKMLSYVAKAELNEANDVKGKADKLDIRTDSDSERNAT